MKTSLHPITGLEPTTVPFFSAPLLQILKGLFGNSITRQQTAWLEASKFQLDRCRLTSVLSSPAPIIAHTPAPPSQNPAEEIKKCLACLKAASRSDATMPEPTSETTAQVTQPRRSAMKADTDHESTPPLSASTKGLSLLSCRILLDLPSSAPLYSARTAFCILRPIAGHATIQVVPLILSQLILTPDSCSNCRTRTRALVSGRPADQEAVLSRPCQTPQRPPATIHHPSTLVPQPGQHGRRCRSGACRVSRPSG